MAGSRKYVDLRYMFMRGLIQKERKQRSVHYLKSSAECTSRAIVSLELSEHPIKSVNQAQKLQGIGGETKKKLESILEEKAFSERPPVKGRFVSSAGALLLALLEEVEKAVAEGHSQDRAVLVPEDRLRKRAEKLSEEPFLDDASQTGFCQAWWRIEVLIKRDLIKRRTLNKEAVYQLLPLGQEAAQKIKEHFQYSAEDVYARSADLQAKQERNTGKDNLKSISRESSFHGTQEDFLYTNDDGSDGVLLQIDHREWGGDRVGLGELCAVLDREGVVYRSRQLSTGDYSWVWRCDGTERCLPYLVERKRADDMARTLKEERFWPQINKMLEWKKDFDGRGIPGSAYYIVEGDPSSYVVKCADGCQGVGRCGYPSLAQVKCAFRDLSSVPELIVQTTDDIQGTMATISSITAELQQRVKKGDFDQMIAMELDGGNLAQEDTSAVVISLDSDDSDPVPDIDLRSQSKVEHCMTMSTSLQNRIHVPDSRKKVSIEQVSPPSLGKHGLSKHNSMFDKVKSPNVQMYRDDLDPMLRSEGDDSEDWKCTARDNKCGRVLHENHRNVDSLYDADQVSKSKKGNLKQNNLPLEPLAQYHCSNTYTGPSPSKKQRPSPGKEYRPKMTPQTSKQNINLNNLSTQNRDGELLSHDTRSEFVQNEAPVWRPKVKVKKTLNLTPHHSFVEPVTKQTPQRSRSSTGKVYLMKSVRRRSGVNTDSSDSCDSTDFPLKNSSKATNDGSTEYLSKSERSVVKLRPINTYRPVNNIRDLKTSEKSSSPVCKWGDDDVTNCEHSRNPSYDGVNSLRKLPYGKPRVSQTSPSSSVNPLLGFGLCPSDCKVDDSPVKLRKSSRSKRPVKRYTKEYDVVDSDSDSETRAVILSKDTHDSEDSLPDLDWVPPKSSKYSSLSSSSDDDELTKEKLQKSNVSHKGSNICKIPSFKKNCTAKSGGHNSRSMQGRQLDHQSESSRDDCSFMQKDRIMKDRIMSENIETIISVLPHLSRSEVATALKQHGGNVEMCVASLLDESFHEGDSTMIDLTG